MAKNDDPTPEFENLNFPTEDFEAELSEGMPDPTASLDPVPEEDPKGKKKKKKKEKKEKKPKPPKAKKPRRSRARSSEKANLIVSLLNASPYTILLAISLCAIVIAVVYMAIQIVEYGGDYKAKTAPQTASIVAPAPSLEPAQTKIA